MTSDGRDENGPGFCRFFKHWRSGKVYDAHAYGYRAWPIGRRGGRS